MGAVASARLAFHVLTFTNKNIYKSPATKVCEFINFIIRDVNDMYSYDLVL